MKACLEGDSFFEGCRRAGFQHSVRRRGLLRLRLAMTDVACLRAPPFVVCFVAALLAIMVVGRRASPRARDRADPGDEPRGGTFMKACLEGAHSSRAAGARDSSIRSGGVDCF